MAEEEPQPLYEPLPEKDGEGEAEEVGLMLPLGEAELLVEREEEVDRDALSVLTMAEMEADRVPLELNEPLFVTFQLRLGRALLVPQRVALTVTVPLRDCVLDVVGDWDTEPHFDWVSDTVALPLNWLAVRVGEGVKLLL